MCVSEHVVLCFVCRLHCAGQPCCWCWADSLRHTLLWLWLIESYWYADRRGKTCPSTLSQWFKGWVLGGGVLLPVLLLIFSVQVFVCPTLSYWLAVYESFTLLSHFSLLVFAASTHLVSLTHCHFSLPHLCLFINFSPLGFLLSFMYMYLLSSTCCFVIQLRTVYFIFSPTLVQAEHSPVV